MNPSSSLHGSASDDSPDDDAESTPTYAPPPPLRDQLESYTFPSRPGPASGAAIPGDGSGGAASSRSPMPDPRLRSVGRSTRKDGGKPDIPSADELARLREAMNAQLVLEQRMRKKNVAPAAARPSRVSPISEEDGGTATDGNVGMDTIAREPVLTASTESTESVRTVRASMPATPAAANAPLRTPSYPFPYIPGTPRFSAGFHEPFIALSPTSGEMPSPGHDTPGRSTVEPPSGESTPAPNRTFMPSGVAPPLVDDPRFPSPNLYELVLQLNSEPGLEQWWTTTANLMHDHFKAERATLVLPLDPTDIENVPWAQKATFCMHGSQEDTSPMLVHSPQSDSPTKPVPVKFFDNSKPQKLHRERLRPRLEARHSYAGHGRDSQEPHTDISAKSLSRPAGPIRTATHTGGVSAGDFLSLSSSQHITADNLRSQESLRVPEASSVTSSAGKPYAKVFSALKKLDHEIRPLIESGGVGRVLDIGKIVTVTRDYLSDDEPVLARQPSVKIGGPSQPTSTKLFGNYRSVFASDNTSIVARDYEEHEQHASSPWAQSPAPSPAIQEDEDENPFFRSEEQEVEASFNPTTTPKDYSHLGQVEAIGVDGASTVIHIPLVHPVLSQPMPSSRGRGKSGGDQPGLARANSTPNTERKFPIAILSILSPAVPYPQNLVNSLKLLGPHLATSFAIAQQLSRTLGGHVTIRHRRTASGKAASSAPMTIEPKPLDDITTADLEAPSEGLSGSVTSPSEYSARSKTSPTSSIAGTPGWDPATHGWSASRSATGTPALTASEMFDNYFEARKHSGHHSANQTQGRSSKRSSGGSGKLNILKPPPSSDDDGGRTSDFKLPAEDTNVIDHDKRHSFLHSYGADLHSSFGLTSASGLGPRDSGHDRRPSYADEMPPPSERLLRTIIDSVPVQIFTAEPDTGNLSWVNSKFLVYRGLEPRHIINEPWQAIHPEDRDEFMTNWHRSLRTAQQLQQKVRLERFDGTYRWFYVRAAPLKDKRQKIVHWIGTMMDFHEQHIAEVNSARQQETAAAAAKYRALANSSPQIVFAANRSRGVTFCNSQWLHYSGQTETQALAVGFMDHVHPDDLAKCKLPTFDDTNDQPTNVPTSVPSEMSRASSTSVSSSHDSSETERGFSSSESSPLANMPQRQLSELASTGILKVSRDADGRPSYSTEVRLKSKDGNYRWHLIRVLLAESVPRSGDEDAETWYGTCTDINDHKTLERDLKETMDEKSRFLSNMSHEIRTPLNGITGMVNFLIDSSLSPEQMEHVNIIRTSTEGLRGLINDILDLSKAEAGMIQLNMDWLYPRSLIEEVNDLTSTMAIDKGLELNYIVEDNVPAQIKGDRFRLRQILLNIVGNAIKFTARGEVFIRCSVKDSGDRSLARNELYIQFDVIDTGRGFNDREAEFLFKRFSQIDGSSTRQHGGTGLGLVISQQLAQLHHGDMSAKGVPGKGSTFTFFVKATLPSKVDRPPPTLPTPGGFSIPILPVVVDTPSFESDSGATVSAKGSTTPSTAQGAASTQPQLGQEYVSSPQPYASSPGTGKNSPAASSISSYPSLHSNRTASLRSERSSASSIVPDGALGSPPINLTLPADAKKRHDLSPSQPGPNAGGTTPGTHNAPPLMYSILVVCPLKYSLEATVGHISKTLPKETSSSIVARESLAECKALISGENPVIFTHVVMVLKDDGETIALIDQILASRAHSATSIVVITDLAQRRRIMEQAPQHDYQQLGAKRRLRFVFKPLKPSRFASIFDPGNERETSMDHNQDSAQQIAVDQKQVFAELSKRLGNRNKRVLLVEDNRTNQLVVLKFLAKVSLAAEKAQDGVECLEKVFAQPPGHYSIILCDLHMPNKDGYQTCREIRRWERRNGYPHSPIIALSANVLGDVHQKCVDAGFNSYLTKPVDFKELSQVLVSFMDPHDPSKPHAFMKRKAASGPDPA